jgi:hypothetical protein
MKPIACRILSRFLLSLVVVIPFLSSQAQQLGHYIGGFTGLENGSSPPPGFYAAAFGLAEPVNSIKGPDGKTVLKPDINVGGVIAAYSMTTRKKLLGGNYAWAFMVPVLNTRFNSNLFNASAESAGVSDILFEPLRLGWTRGEPITRSTTASTLRAENSTRTRLSTLVWASGNTRSRRAQLTTATKKDLECCRPHHLGDQP